MVGIDGSVVVVGLVAAARHAADVHGVASMPLLLGFVVPSTVVSAMCTVWLSLEVATQSAILCAVGDVEDCEDADDEDAEEDNDEGDVNEEVVVDDAAADVLVKSPFIVLGWTSECAL